MTLEAEIGKPDYKDTVIVKNAANADIIRVLEGQYNQAVKDAAPIAYRFKGRDRMETARNIWIALKNDVTYQKDGFGYQDIRMPRRFWHTRTGDCKSYTINTLAIWANIYPMDGEYFKYAAYVKPDVPTHVYGVIRPVTGGKIIIDGCWVFFNSEKSYTFSKESNNMQVRVLSGTDSPVPHSRSDFYDRIYSSLDARNKEQFKNVIQEKLSLELAKHDYINGDISMGELYDHICAVEGIGKVRRKKGRGKKALHWFNAAALFLGRAAFLLFVTLNVNGLASKLQHLKEWGKFDQIGSTWYTLGGSNKKFEKIIKRGSMKHPLWLSKKARMRYEARYGGKRDATGKPIQDGIGVAPAVAAAALAAVPVLAALIPKMIAGFKASGAQGQADANEMASQGQDMVQDVKTQGYKPDAETIDVMLPPGQSADLTAPMPAEAREQEGSSAMDLTENIEGIGDAADVLTALGPALGSLATVGFSELGKVVSKSRNKNIRAIGDGTMNIAAEGAAAYAAQRAGYSKDAAYLQTMRHKHPPKGNLLTPKNILIGGAALLIFSKVMQQSPAQAPAR